MNPSNALRVAHIIPSIDVSGGDILEALIGLVLATRESAHVSVISTPIGQEHSTLKSVQNRIPETAFNLFAPLGDNARSVSPSLFWWLFKNIKTYDVVHIHTVTDQHRVRPDRAATECALHRMPARHLVELRPQWEKRLGQTHLLKMVRRAHN